MTGPAVDRERQAAARAAQGLPAKVTDPVVLRQLAVLFSAPALPVDARPHARASTGTGGSELASPGHRATRASGGTSTPAKEREGRRTHDDPRSAEAG